MLVVFYFSNRTYAFLSKFFTFIMFANIVLVLAITVIAAKPQHYWQVLLGYLGITFLAEGYPAALPQTDALALFNQPGGSLMWVRSGSSRPASAWAATPARSPACSARPRTSPPRRSAGTSRTRTSARKMQQWVKLGGYSLILWWAIIGGLIMTYLYSVAGLAYLHEDFLKTGNIPSGVAVPIQMATIAQGVMGPMAGWLMLLFIMVTLYDAQFPLYDTYIGRTTCDAIAVTGKARRSYRFYYFVVVTAAVLAGFYLITVAQPFILWIGVAISALVYRSIGAWQILLHQQSPAARRLQGQPAEHDAAVDHRGDGLRRRRLLDGDRATEGALQELEAALLAALWALMMLLWMGGLLLGLRGVWPLLQRPSLTPELVIPLVWLVIGTAAWGLALSFGLQRFRRR